MFKLLPFAKKYRKEIILGPIFKFIEAFLELLLPFILALMVDNGLKKNDPHYMKMSVLALLILSIIGLVCAIICQYYASVASQGFGTELRNHIMKKINQFSYAQLDHFGSDTLVTRLTNDITQVQTALAMVIRLLIRAPFLSIGAIVMAFLIDKKMGFIFLAILPIFVMILYFIIKYSVPLYKKVQQKLDIFNDGLAQNLTGVRVIRAFAKRKKMTKKMQVTSDDLAVTYQKVANLSALLSPLTTFILNIGILCILYFSAHFVHIGQLPQGNVLALVNYMSQMLLALIIVSNLVVLFTRAQASANRISEVLNSQQTLTQGTEVLSAKDTKKENLLSFQQVSFRYTKESGDVLNDISFQMQKGEVLGVIGGTGSGKSSLIPLIFHEYEASKGEVRFFEKNILNLETNSLKAQLSLVPQKATLFTGTIRENLAFGKAHPTDEECYEALKIAQLDTFVKNLPEGLETPVFEGGQNFSGGQRQRLTIARALMKKPKLLILDDSLSALDYQTDLKLRQALKKHLAKTALLIISQRVSSLQSANQILVLKEGKQVGLGDHETLLKENPTYQEIYHSQQEADA